ncbi:MAG: thioredoxin domain-containing protein [Acidobacteria bacterium]|nr:thioredoxin domain-containing protein [Acidobacteriota bacterium]
MKRFALASVIIALTASASAQATAASDPVLDLFLPNCAESKLTSESFGGKLPGGMTGEIFSLESSDPSCHFGSVRVKTGDGRTWVGNPWPLYNQSGTPVEKIKALAWSALQLSVVIEPGATEGALQKLRVSHVTESGRIPVDGVVDTAGTMFFPGDFAKNAADMKAKIDARLAPIIAVSPTRGPKDAPVTIVEFSDFQCPSCKRGSEAFEPIFEAASGKVRHIRIDMPIIKSHPWAFPAAIIGRAIWRQNPDVFWKYKKTVYEGQADLNAFEIDRFGRNFAEDHGLDLKRYDADVASEDIQKEILAGLGTAFTMQVAATPTYFVNGTIVATGADSAHLKAYVEKLLTGK